MGSYREAIAKLLQKFSDEVGPDILEEVKLEFLAGSLPCNVEVLEANTLVELYEHYLKNHNNDQKRLTLKMIEVMDNHIKDLNPVVKQEMDDFKRRLTEEWLEPILPLYGREKAHLIVSNYLKENSVKVLNLWGRPGIGKSHLAKYLADHLPLPRFGVHYVDLWHVSSVTDLLHRLLMKMGEQGSVGRSAKASFSELGGQLVDELRKQDAKCQVLILDDLSNLIDGEQMHTQLKLLLDGLVEFSDKSGYQLKILVTSRRSSWTSSLASTRGVVYNIELDPLSYEHSTQFPMSKIPAAAKERLLSVAQGRPYTLDLFKALAQDCPEFLLSEADKSDFEINPVEFLLMESFNKLAAHQKKILTAVMLFGDSATLGAVCKVVNGKESDVNRFCEDVLAEFNRGIWLRFQRERIVKQSEIMVAPYHSAVAHVLRKMILQHQCDGVKEKEFKQISYAYIDHYMALMVELGGECMSNPLQTSDTLLKEKSNICQALRMMSEFDDIAPLFNAGQGGTSRDVRSDVDIAHMFLCVHEFHNHFADELLNVLKPPHEGNNDREKVLAQTLLILTLTAEKKWKELEETTADSRVQDICGAKNLSRFCKGLRTYAKAALNKHAHPTEEVAPDFQKQLESALREVGCCSNNGIVKTYFSAHVCLMLPRSMQEKNPFKKSLKEATSVGFLKPVVYASRADQSSNNDALKYYRTAAKCYENCGRTHCDELARCWYKMSALSCELVTQSMNDQLDFARKAFKICEDNSLFSLNKETMLVYSEQLASCHFVLAEEQKETAQGKNQRLEAVEAYRRVSDILSRYTQSCNLSSYMDIVERTLQRQPSLIDNPKEAELVKVKLQEIRDLTPGSSSVRSLEVNQPGSRLRKRCGSLDHSHGAKKRLDC